MPASTPRSDQGHPAVVRAEVLPESRLFATKKQAWEGLYVAYIGKYLSSLRKLTDDIVLTAGFETQL